MTQDGDSLVARLEPCPFCGCTDVSNNDNGHEEWFECDWCHATSGYDPEFESEPTSFHWNRRAALSRPEQVGALAVSDAMVKRAAAVLLGRVNAPEQEIYSAARAALEAALPGEPSQPVAGSWEIDRSTDNPILTYEKCSVIQDEQAHYVMRLIRADLASQPVAVKALRDIAEVRYEATPDVITPSACRNVASLLREKVGNDYETLAVVVHNLNVILAALDRASGRALAAESRLSELEQEAVKVVEPFANGDIDVSGAAIIIGYSQTSKALQAARAFVDKLRRPS